MTSNKIVLSALAALTLGTVAATAGDIKLYSDANGQVFTTAGEGRTELTKSTPTLASHASKLKFSGLTYIGYRYTDNDTKKEGTLISDAESSSQFEIRRGYFQLKAYLLDDPKSYYRLTFDVDQNDEHDLNVRAKYAYLYLNEILPSTGVEVGLVHRPWHDYEEHNAWYFRNISKVLIENKNAADLSNSADFGINFKTKTQYFDSEIGLFNGEGYHDVQNTSTGMSLEWRATAHLLGVNGKDKQNKKTYFDASFFGQYNQEHKTQDVSGTDYENDLIFYGLHSVYNQPSFLISAQYIMSEDTAENSTYVSSQAGAGYSVNGEYRLGVDKEYRILGRYDSWTPEKSNSTDEREKRTYIAGFAWDQSKNIQWVANATINDNEKNAYAIKDTKFYESTANGVSYMLTAQVEF